jgi:hypothetical protein
MQRRSITRRAALGGAGGLLLVAKPSLARRVLTFGGNNQPPISTVNYGAVYKYNNGFSAGKFINSDVWATTWASDGNIYAAHDDSNNWQATGNTGNLQISKLSDFSTSMTGTIVNDMNANFGGQTQPGNTDNATFKAMGMISVNGTLYVGVAKQVYGQNTGIGTAARQSSANMQIIKSSDHGVNWTPLPPNGQAQPYPSPMFSGLVNNTCFFVQYATADYQNNTVDGSDQFVYAVSNDGFWNNGNKLFLGRVLITDLPKLDGTLWSYYQGGDGSQPAAWVLGSAGWASAQPIINPAPSGSSLKVSSNGVQYLPAFKQYVHIQWWYPSIVNNVVNNSGVTQWDFYTSPAPWGPWSLLPSASKLWNNPVGTPGRGLYNPNIIPKSVSTDGGRTVMITTAGDYNSQAHDVGDYTLTLIPTTLS